MHTDESNRAPTSVSVAILGSGGAGSLTSGALLLEAACVAGWSGLMTRSVGPQIRGGEAAAMVRLATSDVECHAGHFDLLLAIDWINAQRFAGEIDLRAEGLVISDPSAGAAPSVLVPPEARRFEIPLSRICKANPEWRANMLALGAAAQLLGLPHPVLADLVARRLSAKGDTVVAGGLAAIRAGREAVSGIDFDRRLPPPRGSRAKRWLITGNEATGLGAIRGGVRFAAAYPITPATEILEWLAPALAQVGGTLVQAEDELASINMIIGASYGGVPALTATSGPGFSLMIEGIGLATAAEVPIVVVDVMRGGPSTGIPTKSEQADLNTAIYGLHGDAPHLVLAPQSVPDCLQTAQWATALAEALQVPAIVLSDQFLGQAQATIAPPLPFESGADRLRATSIVAPYRRYALDGSGVSPMAIPGEPGGQYTADGLTHTERGIPTSDADEHARQLDKRRHKLETHDFGDLWATVEGDGETAVLAWGSLTGVVREAIASARAADSAVKLIAPRLLSPARPIEMRRALSGVQDILVVEQSHGAQFYKYLRAHYELDVPIRVMHRPGPRRFRPAEILDVLLQRKAA
jgi:2-oxoglutarate ferredoxin oxidoreductase subunit alpha